MKAGYILITALLIVMLVLPVSASISDKLSPTNPSDVNAKIKAEEYAKLITAKETTVTKDSLPFKYNIKKISYNDKMNTMDLYVNLYINGVEKAVRNPIHIRNPPVYHITSTSFDSKSGVTTFEQEENPEAVIAKILYDHALTLKDGKAENDDTLIVYVTEDARIGNTTDGDWYGIRNYEGNYVDRTTTVDSPAIIAAATTNVWSSIYELGFIADTSGMALNYTAVGIDQADLYLYYTGKGQSLGGTYAVQITEAYPDNYNTWAATDYRKVSNSSLNGWQPISAFSSVGYKQFPINNVGVINTTGKTAITTRLSNDVNNTEPPWENAKNVYINFRMASYAGTTSDPYFRFLYSEGTNPPTADFTNTTGFPRSGQLVPGGFTARFTDDSSPAPTTWNWSFGDGNMTNSTAQHPIHTYLDYGSFNVSLEACNAGGCDSENQTGYITVLQPTICGDPGHVIIDFTANITEGASPLPVHFTGSYTNYNCTMDYFFWGFGDGNSSDAVGLTPDFVYRPWGTWVGVSNPRDVFLIIENTSDPSGSNSTTKKGYINVTAPYEAPPPTPPAAQVCYFINATGMTLIGTYTNLTVIAGTSSWGVNVTNTTIGGANVSWWQCGDTTINIGGGSVIGLAGSGALPPEDDTDMLLMAAITGGMVAGVTVAYLFRKRGGTGE